MVPFPLLFSPSVPSAALNYLPEFISENYKDERRSATLCLKHDHCISRHFFFTFIKCEIVPLYYYSFHQVSALRCWQLISSRAPSYLREAYSMVLGEGLNALRALWFTDCFCFIFNI